MSINDWQMQEDIQREMEQKKTASLSKKELPMSTKWIKQIDGYLATPFTGTHCIIAQRDNDGESLYTSHAFFDVIYNTDGKLIKCFLLLDDGIGEIITLDKVVAYTTYDTNELKGL